MDMQQVELARSFEEILSAERPRLVRLCARLSGSREAAEDLAQETLLVAWRHAGRLQEPEQYAPWLSGIARNVCLQWSRRHYGERARLAQQGQSESAEDLHERLPDSFDLEVELERHELADLLDRALALLPADTRRVLIEHYIEESPHAEIAARMGLSEGTVAVRVHRGKLALRRVLVSRLGDEAAAYGISGSSGGWEETRIWGPSCMQRRLVGLLQRDGRAGKFMLRCPACDGEEDALMSSADLSIPFYAAALGDVKSYKPAFTRLVTALGNYYRRALTSGEAACVACGCACTLWIGQRARVSPCKDDDYEARLHCRSCGWASNNSLWGLTMALPEAQRFWSANPRFRSFPASEIESAGSPALVQRMQSLTGRAALDVVVLRHNFEVLQVHTTPGT